MVCPYNISKGGGVQECVLAIWSELSHRGHHAIIITPKPSGHKQNTHAGIRFVGVARDVKSPFSTTAQVSVSVRNDELDAFLDTEKFDVLHFHEPWVPILSRQILSRSKAKNVATFHAKMPDNTVSKTIEKVITPYTKSIMKYLSELTAVSDAAAEYVQSLTDKPVRIIPNGIDLSKYRSAKTLDRSGNSILFIGRLEKRKGVSYLLKAFDILRKQQNNLELNLVGEGPDRQDLEKMVGQKSIQNVHFLGYVDEKEKLRLMSEARVMVSPALFGESFGIVLLEAMASGLPIVAGSNPGYTSVMQGYGEISLVDPKDIKTFADRLALLMNDERTRQKWMDWADKYVQQFDYPKIVDKYEKLYLEQVNSK